MCVNMGCTNSITAPPEEAVGTWSDNNDRFVSIHPDGMFQDVKFTGARWVTERSGPITRWETIAGVSTVESNPGCLCCGSVINDVQVDTHGRLLWGAVVLMREQGPPRIIVNDYWEAANIVSRNYTHKASHPAWRDRRNFSNDSWPSSGCVSIHTISSYLVHLRTPTHPSLTALKIFWMLSVIQRLHVCRFMDSPNEEEVTWYS